MKALLIGVGVIGAAAVAYELLKKPAATTAGVAGVSAPVRIPGKPVPAGFRVTLPITDDDDDDSGSDFNATAPSGPPVEWVTM